MSEQPPQPHEAAESLLAQIEGAEKHFERMKERYPLRASAIDGAIKEQREAKARLLLALETLRKLPNALKEVEQVAMFITRSHDFINTIKGDKPSDDDVASG